ncbi:NAD(P)/FAD-dependent oxidoreductase [Celeribacter sp.]|uniref:NAD(P)/FAD-dependent oxidoreductase n=1 Tax=Celeribacter sp. TaxID=1890673 RepID=UPI003A8DFAB4
MFDHTQGPRRNIAVVGAGISGMSAAYYLSPHHDVTLIEAAPRLGGHARTVNAGLSGEQAVDTGFIVFNYATYPNLTRLFNELDVPVEKSEMSFGVSIDNGWLEYGLRNLSTFAAQKRNLMRPQYYKMIADILKFGKHAEAMAHDDETTIGDLVERLRLGRWFRKYYLLPMCGAIWSTPITEVDRFPARSLVRFFRNHALLAGIDTHQWWTVSGGSIEYVRRLEAALLRRGVSIRTSSPVEAVRRSGGKVTVKAGGTTGEFDEIVFACHSDQALAILGEEATPQERASLGAIAYQPNKAVLHRDPRQMPLRRSCWSSWSYRAQEGGIGITYWMNRLQNIDESDPLFVTLNPSPEISDDLIYDEVAFDHPVFDTGAMRAQGEIAALQGENRTWFAGAYNRHGFHEDGIASALRVVRKINEMDIGGGRKIGIEEQRDHRAVSGDLRATA